MSKTGLEVIYVFYYLHFTFLLSYLTRYEVMKLIFPRNFKFKSETIIEVIRCKSLCKVLGKMEENEEQKRGKKKGNKMSTVLYSEQNGLSKV